jgi:hypothetical protein
VDSADRWVVVKMSALADLLDGVEHAIPVIHDHVLEDALRGSVAELKLSLIAEPV